VTAPFEWDPQTYRALMAEEVPDYPLLQEALVEATRRVPARRILELGTGTGETARRVLAVHPGAQLEGLDASKPMLEAAGRALDPARVRLRVQRLDPLPAGPFDLVLSALAVHHLDGPGKADLFTRVRAVVAPGGAFVLADLVVPERPEDVVTPVDGVVDRPSSVADQLRWLAEAGFAADVPWQRRDLAVLVARPAVPGQASQPTSL
jgi:tRNA (cmo5U34)-methyltransferase